MSKLYKNFSFVIDNIEIGMDKDLDIQKSIFHKMQYDSCHTYFLSEQTILTFEYKDFTKFC